MTKTTAGANIGWCRTLTAIVGLTLFEFATTMYGNSLGLFAEANPTVGALLATPARAALVFAAILAVTVGILAYAYPRRPQSARLAAALILGVRVGAVLRHLTWLGWLVFAV